MAKRFSRLFWAAGCLAATLAAMPGCSGATSNKPAAGKTDGAAKSDDEKLQGTWQVVAVEAAGDQVPENLLKESRDTFTFARGKLERQGRNSVTSTYKLDPAKHPKTITLTTKVPKRELLKGEMVDSEMVMTERGIYEFTGNRLRICISNPLNPGKEPPKEFKTTKENFFTVFVLEREKK